MSQYTDDASAEDWRITLALASTLREVCGRQVDPPSHLCWGLDLNVLFLPFDVSLFHFHKLGPCPRYLLKCWDMSGLA